MKDTSLITEINPHKSLLNKKIKKINFEGKNS